MSATDLRQQQSRAKRRVTLVGALVNLLLGIGKIVAGCYGRSQALIADGIHSLSDLLTDVLVLATLRIAGQAADESHPYGHARFETIATVLLGLALIGVAGGVVWDAAQRLQGEAPLWHPNVWALAAAAVSILAKEALYHYTRHVALKTRSRLLQANAWHHRSDAISSVVVLAGVVGVLYGYHFADAVAAIVVGLLIAKIGFGLVIESTRELVDTALPAHKVKAIEAAIRDTEGVRSLHSLRTRQMGGEALVDVHIQVPPDISVSEGHAIADKVRDRLLQEFEDITDVTVHIDAERDLDQPALKLPLRREVVERLCRAWRHLPYADRIERIHLHYLGGKIHVEVYLPVQLIQTGADPAKIAAELRAAVKPFNFIGSVRVHFTAEPPGRTNPVRDAPFGCN
ncbi:hypothetical protein MIT9_P0309 [Methylomarinovum caldicuralii]|uniref:Cation diffusion facilitator family transporter n=1 Tax=Methylomarinovum caldicuralii TaxID=438856 RepID=A0AAU9BPT5_9GAMM|nr:cation diffusion facilitator family transporter [Methylomarinovum caldicuralii]BCX80733.1 hypothetical protein MIT9_P0309 [Methylomarinovum caldicuralii]